MSISLQRKEIEGVVGRLLDNLSLTISSQTGGQGAKMRRKIGELRANYISYLYDGTFSTKLLDCFTVARESGAQIASFANVRNRLFSEAPVGDISRTIVLMGVTFCLSAESRMIALIQFTSRDDVDAMMKTMRVAFDTARDMAADWIDSSAYQALIFLSGALVNHLATTSRPLPRMISFTLPLSLPALTLSNRIYYTAERWEEIVLENKIIHPAFCERTIMGLSS